MSRNAESYPKKKNDTSVIIQKLLVTQRTLTLTLPEVAPVYYYHHDVPLKSQPNIRSYPTQPSHLVVLFLKIKRKVLLTSSRNKEVIRMPTPLVTSSIVWIETLGNF